jgi:hypothetical protein
MRASEWCNSYVWRDITFRPVAGALCHLFDSGAGLLHYATAGWQRLASDRFSLHPAVGTAADGH